MEYHTVFSTDSGKTIKKRAGLAVLPALLLLPALLMLQGCYYDVESELYPPGTTTCDTTSVTYAGTLKPIFERGTCLGCHTGAQGSGNVDLSTLAGTAAVARDNNRLYEAVSHTGTATPMPQGAPKLPDCDITKIRAWVNAGAKD